MIVAHCLVISCCLLAQVDVAPPAAGPSPKFSPKKHHAAPPANPPADRAESEPAIEEGPPARSAYDRGRGQDAADELLDELDHPAAAGDHHRELGHVEAAPRRLRPPELLADALSGPHEGRLPSKPLPLVDALARTNDREQQRQIAVAYWRLAIAQAQLHYARGNLEHLHRWSKPGHKHPTLTESQLATAQAAIEDAEFRVINDGEALATLVGWPDKDLIPATVDRPHVGDYRTEFEKLFSSHAPPPRVRLIHRTMPISRRAIDVHGAALVAAIDALEVTEEDHQQQKTDYLTLAAAFDHLVAEQTAFLASVLRYNEDIAAYAFSVAPATADVALLAKMLIKRPAPPVQPRAENSDGAEETFESDSTGKDPSPRTFRRQRQPVGAESSEDPSATLQPRAKVRRVAVEKPAETAHGGLYQGLLGSNAALQAQQLTGLLHWDRELPADTGEKLTLAECLERVPVTKRRPAIAAYWETREQIARYQVLGERSESLANLGNKLLALRSDPGGAAGMLRLQAAREAAQAAVLDQHIRLLTAQYALVMQMESAPDRPWPLPTTPPHGGDYTVAPADSEPNADRPPGKKASLGVAGTRVIVLHSELTHRARALVFADEFRAVHTVAEPRRTSEIDSVLRAIDWQLRETEVFLGTLTDYNLAVADFVLPLLGPETTAKGVVEKLVVEPAPKS